MLTRIAMRAAFLWALALLLPAAPARAAETAETVLIRQTLEKDRSGLRRGDAELVASAAASNFVVYDAGGYMDPAGWTIASENRTEYEQSLERDLADRRYDISRTVTLIHVYTDKAFVTTVDTGWVLDRESGGRQPYGRSSLWTFQKFEDEWLATGLVRALGDTAASPAEGMPPAPKAIDKLLMDDAADWNRGDAGAVVGHVDEELVAFDSYDSSNPAKLVIIFGDREEFDEWLEERLSLVDYNIDRRVVGAVMSAGGNEALALTSEKVSVTHLKGTATSSRQRRCLWTLSRASGSWKVTRMFLHMKQFE